MKNKYLVGILCVLLAGCAVQQIHRPLQPDQRWVTQTLPNGLTYHLYPDTEQEVSIRLYVHAGSMQETAEQAGYAHFVEHMAFNGTRHYQHNDVIRMFEQSGAQFGADFNAFTGYDRTVYQLDLPNSQNIDKALLWFADIADGLNFDADEVEKEKGVILGEFRASRTENLNINQQFYQHMIQGTSYAEHDPLGTRELVQAATPASLSAFYEQWYQPQLTELVITGNFTLEQGQQWVEKYFSTWATGNTAPPASIYDHPQNRQDLVTPIIAGESPSLTLVFPQGHVAITDFAEQQEFWRDDVTEQLIQARLNAAFSDAAQATAGIYSTRYVIEDQRYSIISVAFASEQREKVQGILLDTLASLRDYGVTQNELDIVLRGYRESLTYLQDNRASMTPVEHANQRVFAIGANEPIQSELDYKASLNAFLNAAQRKSINQHIEQQLRQHSVLVIGAAVNEDVAMLNNTLPQLRKTLALPGIEPIDPQVDSPFKLQTVAGEIVQQLDINEEPPVTYWQLDNGIEVYYLRNPEAKDQVYLEYSSAGGQAALPSDLLPAAEIVPFIAVRSGLGELSGSQFERYLRQKNIGFYNYIGATSHGIEATSKTQELPELLEALHMLITTMKVNPEQMEAVKNEFTQNRNAYFASPFGSFFRAVTDQSFIAGSRYRLRTPEQVSQVTEQQVEQVHQILFGEQRNNTLVVVANIEHSQLTPLLRQYIASLPLAKGPLPVMTNQLIKPVAPRLELALNNENATQYALRILSETPSRDAKLVFIDDIVQRIATQRMLAEVREHKSLDYTPQVVSYSVDGEPLNDWIFSALVDPKNQQQVADVMHDVVQELVKGASQQELEVVTQKFLIDMKPLYKSPAQQAFFMQRYAIHQYGIEATYKIEAVTQSITLDDVNQRIKQLFGQQATQQEVIFKPKAQ
ncbi:M16 family metallopeptidase [Vibrio metoecus]|uniref:M16 family metallopeptidase n=1 Tax=Vibrio metoecus TaxID=1481663 RepID=UPI000BA9A1EB|nr:M16 family metallopeptidase [Vibrio metoecus]PAR35794.1 peptidase M16 [Vibrio metoecus]PAR44134.1 peptidase M16 [Vibrio metoecus]